MRETLFRGKRLYDGEWVFGFYVHCADRWGRDKDLIQSLDLESGEFGFLHEVAPETVGQYTGLLDKNGKGIFEHDICRNTRNGEIVLVKWHGTMAGYVWCKHGESHLSDFGELFRAYDKYEVIGNIHDNPELMRAQS